MPGSQPTQCSTLGLARGSGPFEPPTGESSPPAPPSPPPLPSPSPMTEASMAREAKATRVCGASRPAREGESRAPGPPVPPCPGDPGGCPGAQGPQPDRGRLPALGPVRASAPAHGGLGRLPGRRVSRGRTDRLIGPDLGSARWPSRQGSLWRERPPKRGGKVVDFGVHHLPLPGAAPAAKNRGSLPPLPPPPVRRHDAPGEGADTRCRRPTGLYPIGLGKSVPTCVQCGFPGTAWTTAARASPSESGALGLSKA